MPVVRPTIPPPPTLVAGRYRLLDALGAGGMGVVYRAVDERLDREVAVKLVESHDPDLANRLRREADLLAEVNHPHIVHIFDAGEHDGRPYIVTSLVEGETLRHMIARGPLAPAAVTDLGRQMAGALAAAHRAHIVHRDLKPDNVIVSDGGFARLLDFGIAQRAGDTALTAPGSVIGTAAYLSPEQLTGAGAVPASDVYALGLVLIEALTGRPAFPGTVSEAVGARLVGPPPLPTSIGPRWRALLESMTSVAVEDRPAAADVARDLATLDQAPPAPLAETTQLATAVAPAAAVVAPTEVAGREGLVGVGAAAAPLPPPPKTTTMAEPETTAPPIDATTVMAPATAVAPAGTLAPDPTRVMAAASAPGRPPPPIRGAGPRPARRGRAILVGLAILAALLAGSVAFAARGRDSSPSTTTAPTTTAPAAVPTSATTAPAVSVTTTPVTTAAPAPPAPAKGGKPGKGGKPK